MIHQNILNNVIKPEKVFLNISTKNRFVITKVEGDTIHCRAFTKLKRGQAATPVDYTIQYKLFVLYLENETFKVLE